jgi:acyl transferase domain-containing protein
MDTRDPNSIAVIGIGCRFPGGANDTSKFWSLLENGTSTWSEVPPSRFKESSFYHPSPDQNGTLNHRGGHFLTNPVSPFDAAFFGISSSEAHATDPQQRLQLETAYEAIENAGIPLEALKGSDTSVFMASFSKDYDKQLGKDTSDLPKYQMTGTGEAILSNRISHFLDLKGPSMTIDTGCSGSLVALHQACQGIKTGESEMALVGGSNLILGPDQMISMSLLQCATPCPLSYS